ncbi:MAG: ankyrin repeat domain-containing protein, partial [Vicinamibacteria bacterium]
MPRRAAVLLWTLILAAGATAGPESLTDAAGQGRVDRVNALMRQGADPNAASSSGWTPLMAAAAAGRREAAAALLSAGADADARDRLGRTALDVAERAGHSDVARLLRDRGASGSGKSPNDTVCVRRWGGSGFCGIIDRV